MNKFETILLRASVIITICIGLSVIIENIGTGIYIGCNNDKKPIPKVDTNETKKNDYSDSYGRNDTLPKFPIIHYSYKLIKDSLYFFDCFNGTMAINKIFIDSINLDKDSVWIKNPYSYSYDYKRKKDEYYETGYSLPKFAMLLFAYRDILEKKYDSSNIFFEELNNIDYWGIRGEELYSTYWSIAQEQSGFRACLIRMKLGKKYFNICNRIAKLGENILQLYVWSNPGWTGSGFQTVESAEAERAFSSIYTAVVFNNINVLSKPSNDFHKRKKQFINKLTSNSKNNLRTCLKNDT